MGVTSVSAVLRSAAIGNKSLNLKDSLYSV